MIAVASLQLSAGKSLAGKRSSECTAGVLSLCAKWRHRCEQKHWDQLVHVTVLEQGHRLVEPGCGRTLGFSSSTQGVRSASIPAFNRVLFSTEKVQRNIRLIANDPTVVRHRWNVKQIACVKFNYATIVERNCRGS